MTKKHEKVAALDNEYAKQRYLEYSKQNKQLIFRRRRLAVILTVTFCLFVFFSFQLVNDYQQLNTFKKQQEQVRQESKDVDNKIEQLSKDIALLKDEEYVGKLARSRYNLSKEGEQIYVLKDFGDFINPDTSDKETATTQSQSQSNFSKESSEKQ